MPKNKTMRITGGSLSRRRFLIPPMVDEGSVRPTPDRVREAVFSMLIDDLPNAKVLDLFAGSGAHGFEALSRGASSVRFIEKDPRVAQIIKENIHSLGLTASCEIGVDDATRVIAKTPTELMDIIFVDPPYSLKLGTDFFSKVVTHLSDRGVVVYRCFKKELFLLDEHFYVDRDRVYGGTRVFILRRKELDGSKI